MSSTFELAWFLNFTFVSQVLFKPAESKSQLFKGDLV